MFWLQLIISAIDLQVDEQPTQPTHHVALIGIYDDIHTP